MNFFKFFLKLFIVVGVLGCIYLNFIMEKEGLSNSESFSHKEYAIVLGASVHGYALSEALRARMNIALKLYKSGLVRSVLLSGDGTDEYYSETAAMKKFALDNGMPEEALLTDEKGYNTYLTMLRAHNLFNAKSAYIITQNFHLARAVWVARQCGIDAQGVGAGKLKDPWYYYLREFFARVKDYGQVKLKIYW